MNDTERVADLRKTAVCLFAELPESVAKDVQQKIEGACQRIATLAGIQIDEDADYWCVSHNPDLTETGIPMELTYVRTVWEGHPAQKSFLDNILRDWCRERFGSETQYVQGVAPTPGWQISKSTADRFQSWEAIRWGGYDNRVHRVALALGVKSSLEGKPPVRLIHEETR